MRSNCLLEIVRRLFVVLGSELVNEWLQRSQVGPLIVEFVDFPAGLTKLRLPFRHFAAMFAHVWQTTAFLSQENATLIGQSNRFYLFLRPPKFGFQLVLLISDRIQLGRLRRDHAGQSS